jgi:phosphoesterase RecJ-like protein
MDKTFSELDAFINRHTKMVITTHESPDADGLGAEIALKEYLSSIGHDTFIYNGDPLPDKYTFLDTKAEIKQAGKHELPEDISEYGLIIIDTNTFSNTGKTAEYLSDKIQDFFIVDHHEGKSDLFAQNLILVHASSASEIVANFLRHKEFTPTLKGANALYTGILFDTGGFRYSKTSSLTFQLISWLVENGANPVKLYEELFENNELTNLLLKSKMLSTLETYHEGRLVYMELTPEMLMETGGKFAEGELNINIPLTTKGVEISVLMKQDINGPLKVSMRSKGDIDVSIIAISRNGGGHKNAAGFKSHIPHEDTKRLVLNDLSKFFI